MKLMVFNFLILGMFLIGSVSAVWYNPFSWFEGEEEVSFSEAGVLEKSSLELDEICNTEYNYYGGGSCSFKDNYNNLIRVEFGSIINSGQRCLNLPEDVFIYNVVGYSCEIADLNRDIYCWGAHDFASDCDGDGFYDVGVVSSLDYGGYSIPKDCDDYDVEVAPNLDENCSDGKDNDCNGLIDCGDPACQSGDENPGAVCGGTDESPAKCCGNSCSSLNKYYVDSDGDGFGFGEAIESCNSMPLNGYSLNDLDCNDGSDRIYPGSEICFPLLDDPVWIEELYSNSIPFGCYKCSLEGREVISDSCNVANDGDCKKCSGGNLINDDIDSGLAPCEKCVDKEKIIDDSLNLANDGDCKKCENGNVVDDLNDEVIISNPCKICLEGGGVSFIFDDPVQGDCWACDYGEKVPVEDNPLNDGDCKKCENGVFVSDISDSVVGKDPCKVCVFPQDYGEQVFISLVQGDPIPGEYCWTCNNGEKQNADSKFNFNDGDCKKCENGELISDENDLGLEKCKQCLGQEIIDLTGEIEGEVCKECKDGLVINKKNSPLEENPCRACEDGELISLTGASSFLGDCQRCQEGEIKSVEDGDSCNTGNSLSSCCGGNCFTFGSNFVKKLATCCGGEIIVESSKKSARRNDCCEDTYVSLDSASSCGSCDNKCSGDLDQCYMNPGIFEDCYKCVECLSNSDCASGESCLFGSKKCKSLWPPSFGAFTSLIVAASPTDAINILKSKIGHSNSIICSGSGGYELITVNILSLVPMGGGTFKITYEIITKTILQ